MQRTTIRLDEHLLAQAKQYALRHRRTLTSVIEDGLRALLAPRRNGTRPRASNKAVKLPVSKHKGGLLPGTPSLDCYGELLEWMEKDLPLERRR
ncbi:MAG: hypothetical protein M3119_07175 [Verrucomicrobiota bacterium]|nr:hypothetical protein [Verrucomicrobiota bacterium]